MQQAGRDTSIKVTDQEIADGVEQQVRKVRGNFTSELDYQNELKKAGFQTPEEYRRWLTDQQRRAALQNRLIDNLRGAGKLKPVAPTEQEMRKFFEEQKGSLGSRPATISFRQIIVSPKASDGRQGPRASPGRLDRAGAARRRRLRHRRPPLLPGSWLARPGRLAQLVPPRRHGAASSSAWRSRSSPGWSPIRSNRRSASISFRWNGSSPPKCRPATFCWCRRSIRRTWTVRAPSRAGCATWSPGAPRSIRSSGSSTIRRAASARSDNVPADKLPETYVKGIGDADTNTVVPVFTMKGAGDRDQFVVLQVTSRRSQGEVRYEDVKDRIRQQLGQELAIRRYIDQLRKSTYVEMRI